jgi:hypothetical protein
MNMMIHDFIFTFKGKECAENIIMTSFLTSSGNLMSSVLILSATVFASNGCVAHRSMMLHLTPAGNFLKEENYICSTYSTDMFSKNSPHLEPTVTITINSKIIVTLSSQEGTTEICLRVIPEDLSAPVTESNNKHLGKQSAESQSNGCLSFRSQSSGETNNT